MIKRPAATVHLHVLSLGVGDVMCKGKKPASMSGMLQACVLYANVPFLGTKLVMLVGCCEWNGWAR